MNPTIQNATSTSRKTTAVRLLLGTLTGLLAAGAIAQQQVVQDGRLLDANPQVGGSGVNALNPNRGLSPLVGGNPYATGNIGRGLSLRSYSPIGAPTSFHATLGSGALSNFIRDSVSPADSTDPYSGLIGQRYFDPTGTAPSAAYLQGFYSDPLGQSTRPGYRVGRPSAGDVSSELTVPFSAQDYGTPPGARLSVNDQLRGAQSGILNSASPELSTHQWPATRDPFAGSEWSARNVIAREPQAWPTAWWQGGDKIDTGATDPGLSRVGATPSALGEPIDFRVWPTTPAAPSTQTPSAFDQLTLESTNRPNPGAAQSPATPRLGPQLRETLDSPTLAGQSPRLREARETTDLAALPALTDTSMLPGNDVFTDMRLALSLEQNPNAEWYREMQQSASNTPSLTLAMQERAATDGAEFVRDVLDSPINTLAGSGAGEINQALIEAEAAMGVERFYDAARAYDRAIGIDPANPLPRLGKGHALLAAGEYLSAALNIVTAYDRFPDLVRFTFDLKALLGGPEIVDVRRADLIRLLESNEDSQLRFLLGYIEWHAGMRDRGLANLDKAAAAADPGSLISRFPQMLRARRSPGVVAPPQPPTRPRVR